MNYLYHLSHFVIPVIGFLVTSILAVVVSLVTGGCSKIDAIDPKLMTGITNKLRGIYSDKNVELNENFKAGIKLKENINNNYDSIKV